MKELDKRRFDLLDRINNELQLNEVNLFNFSNLSDQEDLPDSLTAEELLDEKKEKERSWALSI